MKTDLESLRVDNEKLLKDKVEQEEINEILLKKPNINEGHSTSNGENGSFKEESHKWKE